MTAADQPGQDATLTAASPTTARALGIDFAWVIVDLAPDGILVSDDDGRILMANRHIEELFGYDRDTLIGERVEQLLPPRLRNAHETHRAAYVVAPALRPMGAGLELFGAHANGSEFPIEVSLSPAATDQGIVTVVIIRDVTQQRALERDAWAASKLDHDERVAAELHDRVIGHLFGSALTLTSVLARTELEDHSAQRLYDVIEELDTAIQEIRRTVFANIARDATTTKHNQ